MAPLKAPPVPAFGTVLVAAVLLGSILRLPVDRPRPSLPAPLALCLAFVLYVAVQQLPDMLDGYRGAEGYLVGSLFLQLLTCAGAVVATGVVLAGRDPLPMFVALLASAAFAAVLAIAGASGSVGGPLANLVARPDGLARAVGPFGNPNYFGQFLASAVALAAAWWAVSRSWRVRWMLLSVLILIGVGLTLSLSRGGFVALLGGLAAATLVRNRRLGLATICVGAVVVLVAYPAFVEWRLGGPSGPEAQAALASLARSDGARLGGVLAGVPLFLSSPMVGVGFGHYSFETVILAGAPVPIAAHNWYMNVLGELGIVGIALWLGVLAAVAVGLRSRPEAARSIGAAAFGTLVIGSAFLEPPASFQASALTIGVLAAALVGDWSKPMWRRGGMPDTSTEAGMPPDRHA